MNIDWSKRNYTKEEFYVAQDLIKNISTPASPYSLKTAIEDIRLYEICSKMDKYYVSNSNN